MNLQKIGETDRLKARGVITGQSQVHVECESVSRIVGARVGGAVEVVKRQGLRLREYGAGHQDGAREDE